MEMNEIILKAGQKVSLWNGTNLMVINKIKGVETKIKHELVGEKYVVYVWVKNQIIACCECTDFSIKNGNGTLSYVCVQ